MVMIMLGMLSAGSGCLGTASENGDTTRPSAELRQHPLENMDTGTIEINGQFLRVWVARTVDEHEEGMMHVPESEIADDQGMLFIFSDEQYRGFWMKNTITSLDIAYARADGTIVTIWTMPPLTLRTFPSIEPAMYVLEMKAGSFARLGIEEGTLINIPDEVFKQGP